MTNHPYTEIALLEAKLKAAEAEIERRERQMEDLWRLDHHVRCGTKREDVGMEYDIIEAWFDREGNVKPWGSED